MRLKLKSKQKGGVKSPLKHSIMNQETSKKIATGLIYILIGIAMGLIMVIVYDLQEEKSKVKQLTIDKVECYQSYLNMKRDRDNCNKNCYKLKGGDVWE